MSSVPHLMCRDPKCLNVDFGVNWNRTTPTFIFPNSHCLPGSVWVLWNVHDTLWKRKITPLCWDITGFCREIGFKFTVLGKDLVNWEKCEAFMNTNCFRAHKCKGEIGVLLWQRDMIELSRTYKFSCEVVVCSSSDR